MEALLAQQRLAAAQCRQPWQRGDGGQASCSHSAPLPQRRSRSRGRSSRRSHIARFAGPEGDLAPPEERLPNLPFVKIAGQEDMRLALMLNVVDSSIGGVYIVGDRGTGKSVAVRAMADLLPRIEVVQDDPFNSHPSDPSLMGPEARKAHAAGQHPQTARVPTPLVCRPWRLLHAVIVAIIRS